jgi:hypothetical protein
MGCPVNEVSSFQGAHQSVSFRSSEDRNRPRSRDAVYSFYLEYRTMDEIHKASDSEGKVWIDLKNSQYNTNTWILTKLELCIYNNMYS